MEDWRCYIERHYMNLRHGTDLYFVVKIWNNCAGHLTNIQVNFRFNL